MSMRMGSARAPQAAGSSAATALLGATTRSQITLYKWELRCIVVIDILEAQGLPALMSRDSMNLMKVLDLGQLLAFFPSVMCLSGK